MKFNIKKFFVCLIVFSCAMFLGRSNGLASTNCRYEMDFGDKLDPINNQLSAENENFRISYVNMFRRGEIHWFDEDEKRSKAYPTKIVVDINIDGGKIMGGSYISLNTYFDGKLENRVFNISDNDPDMITIESDTCPESIRTRIAGEGIFTKYYIDGENWLENEPQYQGFGGSFYVWLVDKNLQTNKKLNACFDDLKLYGISSTDVYDIFNAIPEDMRDVISKMNDETDEETDKENQRKFIETFVNSPYLDYCTNPEAVSSALTADYKLLEEFNKYFYSCVEKNKIAEDDAKVSGYSHDEINRLIFFLQKYGEEDQVKAICDGKEGMSTKGEIEDKFCSDWQTDGYASKEECNESYEKQVATSFSCDSVASYAVDGKTESGILESSYSAFFTKLIKTYEECNDKNGEVKRTCIVNACENLKNNPQKLEQTIRRINNEVDKDIKKYSTVMINSYKDLVNLSNIKADYKICEFLYGEKGLGKYITGAMNLIMIIGILITVVLSIMDGIKSFASFKDDESKKFFNNLKIRLICIALLIIIPTIINFLVNIVGTSCNKNM